MSGQGFLYDTSAWLALAFSAHPLHTPARAEFSKTTPQVPALFCRATQQSFLRLLSTPNVTQAYGHILTNHEALVIYDQFAASPRVGFVDEPANLFGTWRKLGDLTTSSPKRWMDAYLASFALEAKLPFVTGDGAFHVFPGLNPIILIHPASPGTISSPSSSGGATPPP